MAHYFLASHQQVSIVAQYALPQNQNLRMFYISLQRKQQLMLVFGRANGAAQKVAKAALLGREPKQQ